MMDLLAKNGAFNELLTAIGFPVINFLGSPKVFPWTMIISDIWKGFGFGTGLFIFAALYEHLIQDCMSQHFFDGATRWQQIRLHLRFPLFDADDLS